MHVGKLRIGAKMHEIRAGNDKSSQRNSFIRRTQQCPLLPQCCIFAPTFPHKSIYLGSSLVFLTFLTHNFDALCIRTQWEVE